MSEGIVVERQLHFRRARHGRRQVQAGPSVPAAEPAPARVPRVARLMALAIRFEKLVRDGEVADYADLARLGYVTRARVTQIMNLLNLAPDIQEAILFLPLVEDGRDPITERHLRPLAAAPDWRIQREQWRRLRAPQEQPASNFRCREQFYHDTPPDGQNLLTGPLCLRAARAKQLL